MILHMDAESHLGSRWARLSSWPSITWVTSGTISASLSWSSWRSSGPRQAIVPLFRDSEWTAVGVKLKSV